MMGTDLVNTVVKPSLVATHIKAALQDSSLQADLSRIPFYLVALNASSSNKLVESSHSELLAANSQQTQGSDGTPSSGLTTPAHSKSALTSPAKASEALDGTSTGAVTSGAVSSDSSASSIGTMSSDSAASSLSNGASSSLGAGSSDASAPSDAAASSLNDGASSSSNNSSEPSKNSLGIRGKSVESRSNSMAVPVDFFHLDHEDKQAFRLHLKEGRTLGTLDDMGLGTYSMLSDPSFEILTPSSLYTLGVAAFADGSSQNDLKDVIFDASVDGAIFVDYVKIKQELELKARENHHYLCAYDEPEGKYLRGLIYGSLTNFQHIKAIVGSFEFCQQGALAGNLLYEYGLAKHYQYDVRLLGQKLMAKYWYDRASMVNHGPSLFELANITLEGIDFTKVNLQDYKEYLSKAISNASFRLKAGSQDVDWSLGSTDPIVKALRLYQKAAILGNHDARSIINYLYLITFYQEIVDKYSDDIKKILAKHAKKAFITGSIEVKDLPEDLALYLRVLVSLEASQTIGSPMAKLYKYKLMERGFAPIYQEDKPQQLQLLQESAYAGTNEAQYLLGKAYEEGKFGQKDDKLAKYYLFAAANGNNLKACLELGRELAHSKHPLDQDLALPYLNMAASYGNNDAAELLKPILKAKEKELKALVLQKDSNLGQSNKLKTIEDNVTKPVLYDKNKLETMAKESAQGKEATKESYASKDNKESKAQAQHHSNKDGLAKASIEGKTQAEQHHTNNDLKGKASIDGKNPSHGSVDSSRSSSGSSASTANIGALPSNTSHHAQIARGIYGTSKEFRISQLTNQLAVSYNNLGITYDSDLFGKRDTKQALQYYLKASRYGSAQSTYMLGLAYLEGRDINKDVDTSFKLMKQAADMGFFYAQYVVGYSLSHGVNTKMNLEEGFKYYVKAAEYGFDSAILEVANCYKYGLGTKEDLKKAFAYYRIGSNIDNPIAKYYLGLSYYEGKGVKKDDESAYKYFLQASYRGNADAQYMIGVFYNQGIGGLSIDQDKAFKYFEKAAQQNHALAIFNMAVYYAQGLGSIKKDEQKAKELFKKAKELGVE